MSLFQKIRTHLHDDPLLKRVVRNSSYLFGSSAVSAVMSLVQMIVVVRLLDPYQYGLATGIIMVFATSVNQLLSFRMSEVVVKYAGDAFVHEQKDRAAALIKGIGLTEAATSVLAYLVLVLLAPWAAATFAKDASLAPLFVFYGLFLLANIVYETSVGALQTVNHFGRVARAQFLSDHCNIPVGDNSRLAELGDRRYSTGLPGGENCRRFADHRFCIS